MAAIFNRAQTTDSVEVGLAPAVAPTHPCPACGRASKPHGVVITTPDGTERVEGSRICADRACRTKFNIFNASEGLMPTQDVDKFIQPNTYPCPYCGNESKVDQLPNMMICTNHVKSGGSRHSWNILTGK